MNRMTRRSLILSVASGLVMAHAGGTPARADGQNVSGESAARLDDMIRILGRTDSGVAVRWTKGVLSGIVDQQTMQLLGVSQQIFTRHRRHQGGGFDAAYLELVYFTNLATGEVEDTWSNPYTGRTVAVPTQILGPTRFRIPPSLVVINEPFAVDGIENRHWFEPLEIAGDDVSFSERIESFVPPMTEDGAPMRFHEVFSFQAARQAVLDRALPYVPATVHKVNVISWRNWMEMSGAPGVTMSHGSGRVVRALDQIPFDLAAKNRRFFPDVVENIDDYLEV